MKYNKNPISLREGSVFIDGTKILDGVSCTVKFTPETWSGKGIGEHSNSTRWLGYGITVDITRYRSTNWLKSKISEYKSTGATPEMTVQGIMSDANSDYYAEYGNDVCTCVGCVLTGDLPLTALDSSGDVVKDSVTMNAKDVIF